MGPMTRRVRGALALLTIGASLALVSPARAEPAVTITLSFEATSGVTYESTEAHGVVTPANATPKVILQRYVDGAWQDKNIANVASSNGTFNLWMFPHDRGTYRLRVRSAGGGVVSNEVLLSIKAHTTEIHAHPSLAVVMPGQQTGIYGTVIEPAATPKVYVQRLVNGKWLDRQSGAVNTKTGSFVVYIKPSEVAHYTLRVRSARGSRWSEPFTITTVIEVTAT